MRYWYFLSFIVGFLAAFIIFRKPTSEDNEVHFENYAVIESSKAHEIVTAWSNCMKKAMMGKSNSRSPYSPFVPAALTCQKIPELEFLTFGKYNNKDETKYHINPIDRYSKSIVISVGIGHDVDAEKMLRKDLNESVEFYGADPTHEVNEDLYSKIGKYFPFAVGARNGYDTASIFVGPRVIDYANKTVIYVDAVYFLKELVKVQLIDDMWLDAEGAEYELFDYFLKGGQFDKAGIVFCQINMEVHEPKGNPLMIRKITTFFERIVSEKRYISVHPKIVTHLRSYLINFENRLCVEKYWNNLA